MYLPWHMQLPARLCELFPTFSCCTGLSAPSEIKTGHWSTSLPVHTRVIFSLRPLEAAWHGTRYHYCCGYCSCLYIAFIYSAFIYSAVWYIIVHMGCASFPFINYITDHCVLIVTMSACIIFAVAMAGAWPQYWMVHGWSQGPVS